MEMDLSFNNSLAGKGLRRHDVNESAEGEHLGTLF